MLKVIVPGSVGTKSRHCPSGVDLHCSILDKHPNIQLCFMSEVLGSREKQKGQICRGPVLQWIMRLTNDQKKGQT